MFPIIPVGANKDLTLTVTNVGGAVFNGLVRPYDQVQMVSLAVADGDAHRAGALGWTGFYARGLGRRPE